MKVLIVDDEPSAQILIRDILSPYGECDIAVDGEEAIQAYKLALEEKEPYDLICMDIMMPKIDGQTAVKEIVKIEKEKGIKGNQRVKILMLTALDSQKHVMEAFLMGGVKGYIVKPLKAEKLLSEVRKLGLIS